MFVNSAKCALFQGTRVPINLKNAGVLTTIDHCVPDVCDIRLISIRLNLTSSLNIRTQ